MQIYNNIKSGKDLYTFIEQNTITESSIRTIIEDITSGTNTHFELDQFFLSFDHYKGLMKKKKAIQNEIAQLEDNTSKLQLGSRITEIEQQQKDMRANILTLSLTIHRSRDTEKLKEVKLLYGEGKISAIDNSITEEYLINQQKIAQLSEKLVDNSNEFLVKAEVTNLNYERTDRFQKAIFFFEKGLISAERSKDEGHLGYFSFEYAFFLQEHNQFEIAISLYEKTLKIYKRLFKVEPEIYFPELAKILNNIANLYSAQNDLALAEQYYSDAFEINIKLIDFDPEKYLPDLSYTLNNLANLQSKRNQLKEAEQTYKYALTIRRKLSELNAEVYLLDVAELLNNLAVLYWRKNELKSAEKNLIECLKVCKGLLSIDSKVYKRNLAVTYMNLGLTQEKRNKPNKAENYIIEALRIYKEMAEFNPEVYLPDVGIAHGNLAALYYKKSEFEKAEKQYMNALKVYGDLAELSPEVYLPYIAITKNNLGALKGDKHEFINAEKCFCEALEIRIQLAKVNPDAYLSEVGMTAMNIAIFNFQENKDKSKSIFYAKEAILALSPYIENHHNRQEQENFQTCINLIQAWGEDPQKVLAELYRNHFSSDS